MNSVPVRHADDADVGAILDCATAALGWTPEEPNEALFRWKHLENPSGRSAMWVATDGDDVVGFRAMLQWRFGSSAGTTSAVRAVDTATRPDHQRRGIFRSLTTAAVESLTTDGVGFVFNTPNRNSRPGYLRMGWTDQGRLAARVHVRGPGVVIRIGRARVAANKWSEPLSAGDPIDAVAGDLASRTHRVPSSVLSTVRDADHLRWRYGFEPLHYRVLSNDNAAAIVRLRRRGVATEAVVAELWADRPRSARRIIATAARLPGVDYALRLDRAPGPVAGGFRVPGLGPNFTTRELSDPAPAVSDFRLSLGDIELF